MTAALLLEGGICMAMPLPVFSLMDSVGGLIGWALAKRVQPQPGTMNTLLLLPLPVVCAQTHVTRPQEIRQSTASFGPGYFAFLQEPWWARRPSLTQRREPVRYRGHRSFYRHWRCF